MGHMMAMTSPSTVPAATTLLKGYGTGGFTIKTSNPEAQAYFNNGMQLAHAFAHKAAIAAFRKAEQLDPSCAMCVWGEAWSRGPTINYPINESVQAQLASLADRAAVLAKDNPPKERALIAALQKRYRQGGGKGPGDLAFAQAMDALYEAYPADDEVAIIAADAWMIPASQESNRDHLDRSVQMLEQVLHRSPDNSAAIHFYIHATEMDGVAGEALPYAGKLPTLAPAASHLIHMPSHTYFSVGQYRSAEDANLQAVKIDDVNAARLKPKDGVFGLPYHGHNVQYGEAATLIDGDAKEGLALATPLLQQMSAPHSSSFLHQFELVTAYFVFGRFASSQAVAALPQPDKTLSYALAMWHYARGEADARNGDAHGVQLEAQKIAIGHDDLAKFGDSAAQVQSMVDIAKLVLEGRVAMIEKRWSDAEADYRKAADIQDAKLGAFTDPPTWWYPVRRSVAAALLAKGDPTAAEVEVNQALSHWPLDPQSLRILADCQQAMGHPEQAKQQNALASNNWLGDSTALPVAQL
ncbi:hypothetical protein GCM10007898_18190 [Dyella flagellata]|uniref:Tetratricopeptide repeat-containing protein n=2 Tax=Dyella flagellata TaxID=1867833 RepID=A0ABQ5X9J1_9GAMM|nr:hypothetical protein GCM10007898_18190 [Dyella flagellata]